MADDLNEEQVKAFRLADNKTGEAAGWDWELLDSELADLVNNSNISMEEFGFDLSSLTNVDSGEDNSEPEDMGDFFEVAPDTQLSEL